MTWESAPWGRQDRCRAATATEGPQMTLARIGQPSLLTGRKGCMVGREPFNHE